MPIKNKARSWSEGDLKNAVRESKSIRQVLQKLGLREAGGNYSHVKKYIVQYKLSTAHFTGQAWNKGMSGMGKYRIKLKDILVKNSTYQSFKLKKRLFSVKLKPKKCEECGWCEISVDGRLPLELDHINGNRTDNRLTNLRVLCPNCHSLKSTHRGCNIK